MEDRIARLEEMAKNGMYNYSSNSPSYVQPLPPGLRSDLRFFAFYLGNGTLLLPSYSIDLNYGDVVVRGDDTVGRLFALLFSDCQRDLADQAMVHTANYIRMRAWLAAQCDPTSYQPPELTPAEQSLSGFDVPWKDAVVFFGRKIGLGTLAPDVLDGYEYLPDLFKNGGSWLEAAVMVYANVLRLDATGSRPMRLMLRGGQRRCCGGALDDDTGWSRRSRSGRPS